MAQLTNCLMSTVINTSGGTKYFGFLGPRGKELADGGELSFFGHPIEYVGHVTGGRVAAMRNIDGLSDALIAGDLEIKETPNPVLYDGTSDVTKMLKMENDALYSVDPCWLATDYSSAIDT